MKVGNDGIETDSDSTGVTESTGDRGKAAHNEKGQDCDSYLDRQQSQGGNKSALICSYFWW